MKKINYNSQLISKYALGTVQLGLDYGVANQTGKPSFQKAKEILDFVISQGVNCFDTADGYGDSQQVLGDAIDTNRNTIITKVSSEQFISFFDTTIENMLAQLQTKQVFGLLLHDASLLKKWSIEYDEKIKIIKGKTLIKYFGVSIYTTEDFNNALNNQSIDIIQIPFNLFDLRALELNWFDKAKENNKLIMIRSIYLQGLLLMDQTTVPDKLAKSLPYIKRLEDICNQNDLSRQELICRFINSVTQNSIVLFGCETLVQAKENLAILNENKELDKNILETILSSFKQVEEEIYNPSKW